jgi:Grx4 family monothiol glutaredoxin
MASFVATPGQIAELTTISHYNEVKNGSQQKALIFFWAQWHEPSAPGGVMHQIVAALAEKYAASGIAFCRAEAEALPEVSAAIGISVVPSFVGLLGGTVVGKIDGAKPADLNKLVKSLSEMTAAVVAKPAAGSSSGSNHNTIGAAPVQSGLTDALRTRIKTLLASAPILLFMKGSPAAPRCGFSRQTVEILQSNEVPFASFDILGDEEIRGGLKLYSEWPTYPQLYVGSELIGGLDILKEMVADTSAPLRTQLRVDEVTAPIPQPKPINDRLKDLISASPVVVFMKGSPDAPRCGFSRTLCQLLSEHSVDFSHFDILTDEEVRAGLKVYSDWPTYPQVYVNGSLVGGLDIVKEMAESGPLKPQLNL